MQFLPMDREEMEATLMALSRALEEDTLTPDERAAVRSVLQKVGANKEHQQMRAQAAKGVTLGFVLPPEDGAA